MPKLTIPAPHQHGLRKLRELDPAAAEALIASLQELRQVFTIEEAVSTATARISEVNKDDLSAIIKTLDSLHEVRVHFDLSARKLAENVVSSLRANESDPSTQGNEDILLNRLSRLLAVNPMAISAKARVLDREHQYLFHHAKLITDLRPVFGEKVGEAPSGMIVSHTLKIVYHEGMEDHKELYLVLDHTDLANLKEIVNRAEEKERSLRFLLSAKSIDVF